GGDLVADVDQDVLDPASTCENQLGLLGSDDATGGADGGRDIAPLDGDQLSDWRGLRRRQHPLRDNDTSRQKHQHRGQAEGQSSPARETARRQKAAHRPSYRGGYVHRDPEYAPPRLIRKQVIVNALLSSLWNES